MKDHLPTAKHPAIGRLGDFVGSSFSSVATFQRALAFEGPPPVVRVPTDEMLDDPEFLQSLATQLASRKIPRRLIPDWIATRLYEFEGHILWDDLTPFDLSSDELIDEAFGEDGTLRWVSNFLKVARRPWAQKTQGKVKMRLRLVSIGLSIEEIFPELLGAKNYLSPTRSFNVRHSFSYTTKALLHKNPAVEPKAVIAAVDAHCQALTTLITEWFDRSEFDEARQTLKCDPSARKRFSNLNGRYLLDIF